MSETSTLSALVQRVVTRLSMVPGVSVQVYAEDQIAEMIQHKFDTIRDMVWWDDMMTYVTVTQDANGRPVENVVRQLPSVPVGDEIVINKYSDIQLVWAPNKREPLPGIARRDNPSGVLRQGDTCYKLPDATKVIRFAPFRPGITMNMRVKTFYGRFAADDIVPFDDQALILGAAYDYLEDDGTNPGQIDKFRVLYTSRMDQLLSAHNDEDIPLHPMRHPDASGYQVV